jgi:molybdopterin-guanine dinucleotide biosynthesis protein B
MDAPGSHPPVIGVSGKSGSGKTLLIERLVPRLMARGLRVAVVKHCTHRIEADAPGKDSDRLFRAGADVLAAGPSEAFARFHAPDLSLPEAVRRLATGYDLCIAEGYRDADIPRIRIAAAGDRPSADDRGDVLLTVADVAAQIQAAESAVWDFLVRAHRAVPTMALILIGGPGQRAAPQGEVPARILAALTPHSRAVLTAGDGPLPEGLGGLPRLPDAPGVEGPRAALLSALRWRPAARWIVLGCDFPLASAAAAQWLLSQTAVGTDAVMPRPGQDAPGDPLFAVYEPTCRPRLEQAAWEGTRSLREALASERVSQPVIPPALRKTWTHADTPVR